MSGLNFSGVASGLDTNVIIESLLGNQQRRIDKINTRLTDESSRKRALGDIKTSLTTFEGILDKFSDDAFGNRKVTVGDDDVFSATADDTSELGDHEITVSALAARGVSSIGLTQSSTSDVIGAGTLTLNLGETTAETSLAVTLSDTDSTLLDLQEAINDQHGDTVQASIIEVSSGSFQLVVSSKDTGKAGNILDDGDGAESSTLTGFDGTFLDAGQATSGGVTSTQDGLDASFTVDGVGITRSSNEIDDVLTGVEFKLKGTSATSVSLKIDTDFDEVLDAFEELANGYNDIQGQVNRLTDSESGALKNDSDLRALKTTLQGLITRFIPNSATFNVREDDTTGFTALSQIGFATDKGDGKMTVDRETLKEGLEDHFDEIKTLFLGNNQTSDPNVTLAANLGVGFSGSITLDTLANTATLDGTTYNLTREGNSMAFGDDSPYKGMVFFVGQDSSNVTIDVAAGLNKILEDQTEGFTEIGGFLSDRVDTIDTRSKRLDDQLIRAQDRLESERRRLTRIFANAEQAISSLNGLQASLGAQTSR